MVQSEKAHGSRSESIAALLRDEVLSGQYRPGERLPSERDLCERFGVSRGVVREALKRLAQLGIVSIQPGGARVVPVEECTLDVLGPLLDLTEIPDPKLVDEVVQMFGVLMRVAAAAAIEKATDVELERAKSIVDEMASLPSGDMRQWEAIRKLGDFYIGVADHLVLRLMLNGLRLSLMERMQPESPKPALKKATLEKVATRLRRALAQRNAAELDDAMHALNRLFRESARDAVEAAGRSMARTAS